MAELRMAELPHFDPDGRARMVDVGEKPVTRRVAVASGRVQMKPETMALIKDRKIQKGDVLELARIAGVMASKKTSDLIPLCHPLRLDSVEIGFEFSNETTIEIKATVAATERTGVEMEALHSVSVAGLVIYDMCKSVDRAMVISDICLDEKSGGKSGHFQRTQGDGNTESG
jgi:cyclic pyranopterin phosphate synthase